MLAWLVPHLLVRLVNGHSRRTGAGGSHSRMGEFAQVGYVHLKFTCKVLEHPLARFGSRLKQLPNQRLGPTALPGYLREGDATRIAQMADSDYERFLCHLAKHSSAALILAQSGTTIRSASSQQIARHIGVPLQHYMTLLGGGACGRRVWGVSFRSIPRTGILEIPPAAE
ncbi:MAG TPA: hypothetical protein VJQ54_23430 [Candidatus Sulfotelmatobacter sp.]|nr:hypothetical protein [Candidatus Sulfotelmatobacter sp.]